MSQQIPPKIARNILPEFLKDAGSWPEPEAIARAEPVPKPSFPVNFVIGDSSEFRESVRTRGIMPGQLWEETGTGYVWEVGAVGDSYFVLSRNNHAELRVVRPGLMDVFLSSCKEVVRTEAK
jgi:hypothetical protein